MVSQRKRLTLDLEPMMQRRLKVLAALRGTTMRQYCVAAIERQLARDERNASQTASRAEAALDRLARRQAVLFRGRKLSGDSATIIREARRRRASTR